MELVAPTIGWISVAGASEEGSTILSLIFTVFFIDLAFLVIFVEIILPLLKTKKFGVFAVSSFSFIDFTF